MEIQKNMRKLKKKTIMDTGIYRNWIFAFLVETQDF